MSERNDPGPHGRPEEPKLPRRPSRPEPGSCEEALLYVYEYLDGELEPEIAERIDEHLRRCVACYPYFDFERLFLDHVRERGLAARAGDRLLARVRETLRGVG